MTRKKLLVTLTIAAGLIGAALMAVPFTSYLGLSATAGSSLPRINIKDMEPGTFAYFDNGRQDSWKGKYLVIKEKDGAVNVFELRVRNGMYAMPDHNWWNTSGYCTDFRPEVTNGKLIADGHIKCMDQGLEASIADEWQWDYAGKHNGKWTGNLHSPRFVIEGNEIVIGKYR